MKLTRLKSLLILSLFFLLVSCGDDDEKKKDNDIDDLAEYYFQFKADGILKTFETDEPLIHRKFSAA